MDFTSDLLWGAMLVCSVVSAGGFLYWAFVCVDYYRLKWGPLCIRLRRGTDPRYWRRKLWQFYVENRHWFSYQYTGYRHDDLPAHAADRCIQEECQNLANACAERIKQLREYGRLMAEDRYPLSTRREALWFFIGSTLLSLALYIATVR